MKRDKPGWYWEKYGDDIGCRKYSCQVCGAAFWASRPARYCSYRCTNDAYMKRRKTRQENARYKVCAHCQTPFTAKRSDTKTCSSKCRQAEYRARVTDGSSGNIATTGRRNGSRSPRTTGKIATL